MALDEGTAIFPSSRLVHNLCVHGSKFSSGDLFTSQVQLADEEGSTNDEMGVFTAMLMWLELLISVKISLVR